MRLPALDSRVGAGRYPELAPHAQLSAWPSGQFRFILGRSSARRYRSRGGDREDFHESSEIFILTFSPDPGLASSVPDPRLLQPPIRRLLAPGMARQQGTIPAIDLIRPDRPDDHAGETLIVYLREMIYRQW